MAGQGAQVAIRADPLGVAVNFVGGNGHAAQVGASVEEIAHNLRSLFRLERAGAIDQDTARLEELSGLRDQPRLQRRQARNIALALDPGDVGMAPDGSGRRTGRIEQERVERYAEALRCVGSDCLCLETKSREVLLHALKPAWRAVNCDDPAAGGGELRALAARSRAEIGDAQAADVAEQLCR